jgi:Zn-dependent protease/CBS domain-containing protein
VPHSIAIGSIAETAIRLHWSFILFFTLLCLAVFFVSGATAALTVAIFLCLIFSCIVLHEFGHIRVARLFGVHTPEVMLLPIGGLAKLQRIPNEPQQELAIAVAGPAVNFVLFGILSLVLGRWPELDALARLAEGEFNLVEQLALFNLVVGLFNLLPAFPMDGGRILRAVLTFVIARHKATRIAAWVGQGVAIALALLGLMSANFVLLAIGIFIFFAARSEAKVDMVRHAIGGTPVAAVMVTDQPRLGAFDPVLTAAEALVHSDSTEFPVVDDEARLLGVVLHRELIDALSKAGPAVTTGTVMRRDIPTLVLHDRAESAVEHLQNGAPAVAVVDSSGRYLGLVNWPNLLEKMALESALTGHRKATRAGPI